MVDRLLVASKLSNITMMVGNEVKNTRKIRINRDGGYEHFENPLKTSTTAMEDDDDDDWILFSLMLGGTSILGPLSITWQTFLR